MSEYRYHKPDDRYILHRDGEPYGAPLQAVGLAIDIESGTLHKHGNPDRVQEWVTDAQAKFNNAGFPDMANTLVCLVGPFPVEELNKCLTITGYAGVLYQKVIHGQLQHSH